ncbi:tRNA-dependent cyclodipeptide synthase [Patescibacteria group bacterium]|jgi:tRNA-dependent cyclodipeptide synthase|nr:tRNA-dependent cyclodipeptide synthase [Patescibacteria group bacterium]
MEYFNVTEREIEERMFNIFVGISLGNKLLTPELCRHYVSWAHTHTNRDAVILIADKIDRVNWEVFRGLSPEEAVQKVEQKAYGVAGMFDKARRTLARETGDMGYISHLHIIFWEDVENWGYRELRDILVHEYEKNTAFQEAVQYFVSAYIKMRGAEVSKEDRHRLAGYIIAELPTLLGGLYWDRTLYNLILYPTYVESGMSEFVLDIRGGKYFDANKLKLRQLCVLVEDYLEKPAPEELDR